MQVGSTRRVTIGSRIPNGARRRPQRSLRLAQPQVKTKIHMPEIDLRTVYEQKEPNECIQVDFWGPKKCLKKTEKYVFLTVDRFS